MKLLFDENLSPRLVELLTAEFPGSAHVDQASGRGRPDVEVWEHAIAHGYAIVSKGSGWQLATRARNKFSNCSEQSLSR